MIKNLFHAGIGVVLILVVGRLLAVPSIVASIHHAKYGHIAVIGVFAALALFTAASLLRAFRGSKPKSRPGLPYAKSR
jgi:nitrate reductase gamma subunit